MSNTLDKSRRPSLKDKIRAQAEEANESKVTKVVKKVLKKK